MDIKDKLRQIESLHFKKDIQSGPKSQLSSGHQIASILNGQNVVTPFGSYFYHKIEYPLDYSQGIIRISYFLEQDPDLLAFVGKNTLFQNIDLQKVLFIDTETTGLSGGMGTCAFLIGVGYFSESHFQLEQYFMSDFDNEHALLHALNQLVDKHQLVISYNGKSYDIPLLISRNVLHRLQTPLNSILHLDLLHTIRRLYKHRLTECSLGNAEKIILQVTRNGDVPGYMIPQFYFDYLHNRDARPLQPVFYHNQQDILSMVGLLTKVMQIFDNPLEKLESSYELLSVGKTYEGMFLFERSAELYTKILEGNSLSNNQNEVLIKTALNYKKLKKWAQSVKTWEECINAEGFHPLPYIELAKHYEHRDKNYKKAMRLVEKALKEINIVETIKNKNSWTNYKLDLEYRRKRLQKKLD